jgi:type IV secretion system protein VirB4
MLGRLTRLLNPMSGEGAFSFPTSDFIPIAGFYDADTLITKNGELLKIICVRARNNGLVNEEGGDEHSLRAVLRGALMAHVPNERFAVWVQTRRNKQSIGEKGVPSAPFAARVASAWSEQHHFSHIYSNVCYITVMAQGQAAKLFDGVEFRQYGGIERNRSNRQAHLDQISAELAEVSSSLLAALSQEFKADVLSIRERGNMAYSEQLEWLSELTALRAQPMPITDDDVSKQLYSHELVFGFNAIESRGKGGKRFAAMLTLKHYHDLPTALLDRVLQLPYEMIVTQAFDFLPAKEATAKAREWADIFQMSQNAAVAHATGTIGMLESHTDKPTDYIRQQTMIMVLSDDFATLDSATAHVQESIAKLGLVALREDIRMEEAFWAQVPSNFSFLKRQHAMPFNKAAGLARLNYFPVGALHSKWGSAVTVFPTVTSTPYLFHLHHGDNGHMAVLDYNSFPDSVGHRLLHFILSEASRLAARIVIIDRDQVSRLWVQHMGGNYQVLGGESGIKINPFALEDDKRNRGFMSAWIAHVLEVNTEDAEARAAIRTAVEAVFATVAPTQRRLDDVVLQLQANAPMLAKALQTFIQSPAIAKTLTHGEDGLELQSSFVGVDISGLLSDRVAQALFPYVLHKLVASLDGQPTIVVFREAFELLDNPFVAPRLASLLEMLKEQNVAAIFHTRHVEAITRYSVTSVILEQVASALYVPDDIEVDHLPQVCGLPPAQNESLGRMQRQNGEFLIRHGNEFIPASFQLQADVSILDVLSGDEKLTLRRG